ncbi:MAG: rhomboid family intramembrane serine protease [Methyloligellaceae bacterium]
MFVPVHDVNPLKTIPFQYVTVFLIAVNVLVYLAFGTRLLDPLFRLTPEFALIPAQFLREVGTPSLSEISLDGSLPMPEQFTVVSYMFFHGSFFHLLGNMLFLWVFGDNVEDAMGHLRFLMFYLMCGIFAGLAHAFVNPSSNIPLIGASGAVAGIIAAYLMLHPKVKIWVLVFLRIPLRINAAWALGAWVLFQFFNAFLTTETNVAWWAHIGGLAAGAVLILFMRKPGVMLFDRTPGGA